MQNDKPKSARGGARPGAGRPPAEVKHEGHHITLPPWAVTMLRKLGAGSLSRGIVAALERLRGLEKPEHRHHEKPHE